MDILIKAGQLILSLSILVILHEFGHFSFAKIFKTKVEKFYLFFDPWFSLFKFKKGETEYGIGWLPLGGYVKIAGMIDESMDKEAMKEEPKPWEFRSKPAYQRLLIMIGGVLVNFLLAFFIFWMILFKWGESYINVNDAKYGLAFHPITEQIGLKDGDIVTAVDTFKVTSPRDITINILLDDAKNLTVKRGDSTIVLPIPEGFGKEILSKEIRSLATYRIPVIIDSILPKSNALKAGLAVGDSVVSVNGKPAAFINQFTSLLSENIDKKIKIGVVKSNGTLDTLLCQVSKKGTIGIGFKPITEYCEITHVKYGFWEALPAGVSRGVKTLVGYVKQMKLVFSKEGAKQVGGFMAIGNLFPPVWDWLTFWTMTAFLSIVLAFMNILPIPALDGGHVLFLLYEIITGRKPSEKFLERAQVIGMILLLALLLFANGNDIFRAFFK